MKFINKWKMLFLCGFLLVSLAGCSAPRGSDGKTKVDMIIANETVELTKSQVNTTDISDEELKAELEKLGDDETITIEPTTFSEAMSSSWFDGLIVWPLAQLINFFASFTDAGIGIILTTLLIQAIVFALTYKSQLGSQRMQEIQPELNRIQNKYAGKSDERSRIQQAQEMQKLYDKYDIHPLGTMLVTFIQLPIMMGMYYATMRAAAVVYGSFLGMPLSETPMDSIQMLFSGAASWGPVIVYVLMIVMQIFSLKLPTLLKKYDEKTGKAKPVKKYHEEGQDNPMGNTMNMTMYFTTALIAFMYLSWPVAMSFYWLVSNIIRALQQVVLHFWLAPKMDARRASK